MVDCRNPDRCRMVVLYLASPSGQRQIQLVAETWSERVLSDAAGEFEIVGIPPWCSIVTLGSGLLEGDAFAVRRVTVAAARHPVRLRHMRTRVLEGAVTFERVDAIATSRPVVLARWSSGSGAQARAQIEESGRFRFDSLPAGRPIELWVSPHSTARTGVRSEVRLVSADEAFVHLAARSSANSVAGRVVWAAGDDPRNVLVLLYAMVHEDCAASAVLVAEQYFAAHENQRFAFGGLWPGPHFLIVESEGAGGARRIAGCRRLELGAIEVEVSASLALRSREVCLPNVGVGESVSLSVWFLGRKFASQTRVVSASETGGLATLDVPTFLEEFTIFAGWRASVGMAEATGRGDEPVCVPLFAGASLSGVVSEATHEEAVVVARKGSWSIRSWVQGGQFAFEELVPQGSIDVELLTKAAPGGASDVVQRNSRHPHVLSVTSSTVLEVSEGAELEVDLR